MSPVGEREPALNGASPRSSATPLGYADLGDRRDRAGNANVEEVALKRPPRQVAKR